MLEIALYAIGSIPHNSVKRWAKMLYRFWCLCLKCVKDFAVFLVSWLMFWTKYATQPVSEPLEKRKVLALLCLLHFSAKLCSYTALKISHFWWERGNWFPTHTSLGLVTTTLGRAGQVRSGFALWNHPVFVSFQLCGRSYRQFQYQL